MPIKKAVLRLLHGFFDGGRGTNELDKAEQDRNAQPMRHAG